MTGWKKTRKMNAMNSIFPNIQFTMEIPEDFPDDRLPTLDFACWVEKDGKEIGNRKDVETGELAESKVTGSRSKILYSFYEKSMKAPFLIIPKSPPCRRKLYGEC